MTKYTTPTGIKAVLFCRVSSDQQDYTRQISDLTKLAHSDGYHDAEITIIAHKESASKNNVQNRITIQDLQNLVAVNQIETVYVTEVSRLARRGDVMYSVMALLEEHKICLTIKEPSLLRTYENGESNPMAHMVIAYLSQNAQSEIALKVKRQKSGLLQKQRDGKCTSALIKYGYIRDKQGYLHVDPETAPIVADMFDMYINGESVGTIAQKYSYLPSFRGKTHRAAMVAVSKILADSTYYGHHYKFNYPPIVTEDVFMAARKRAEQRPFIKTQTENIYLCRGIIKCNGHVLSPHKSKGIYFYHVNGEGTKASLNFNVMDSVVFNEACTAMAISNENDNAERIENAKKEIKINLQRIQSLQDTLADKKEESERLNNLYIRGKITENKYDFETARIDEEIDFIMKELEQINVTNTHLTSIVNNANNKMLATVSYNSLSAITDENEQQRIIKEVIKEVRVDQKENNKQYFRIIFKDESLNHDNEYYLYITKGRRIELYHIVGDTYEDFTGTWQRKYKTHKKNGAN